MNLTRIVVLLALLAGLGGYIFYFEIPQAEQDAKKEKLLTVDKDAITGVVLKFPDRELELKKVDAGWRVTRPVDAPADDTTVKGILNALTDAEVQKAIDEVPADLAPFGLTAPEPAITLTVSNGSAPSLAVGAATKIGGKAYIRRGDEPKILLTAASIRLALNKQAKDLRDKQLLTFKDEDVTAITISRPDGSTVTLSKKDQDAWTIQPGGFVADINEVRSFLSALRGARAIDFPDDAPTDLAKYGLDHPRLKVTVTAAGGQPTTLLLGADHTDGAQKQNFAQRDGTPTVVTVGDFTLRSLDKTPNALRDKTLLGFDPTRVGKITLTRKDGSATSFTRGADKAWTVDGHTAAQSKTTTVERFLDDTHDLQGSDVAAEPATDLAALGLDAPDFTIALIDTDAHPMGTIRLSKKDAKYYALRDGTQTAFELRDYMFTRLDKQPKDFINDGSKPAAAPAVPSTDDDPPADDDADGEQ